jgi:hypothetical protein
VRRFLPDGFKNGFSSSFREKKLKLKAELPVGATLPRLHDVGIGCELSINRQFAEPEKLANTAADRTYIFGLFQLTYAISHGSSSNPLLRRQDRDFLDLHDWRRVPLSSQRF